MELNKTVYLFILLLITLCGCQKKKSIEPKESNSSVSIDTIKETKDSIVTSNFSKKLSLNGISFDISVKGNELNIQPSGLKIDNTKITKIIEGTVMNAEIGDLNLDHYPDFFIYITSNGSGSYGTVLGYSVNNGKSLSEVTVPNSTDDPKISKGYMGHDEFAIVEGVLCQRFPIYNLGDTNAKPTGKTRQIQYKLVEGENSRQLIIDKILEF